MDYDKESSSDPEETGILSERKRDLARKRQVPIHFLTTSFLLNCQD